MTINKSLRLVDGGRTDLELVETSFLVWMHHEHLEMKHGGDRGIPGRTILSVEYLRRRYNTWLHRINKRAETFKSLPYISEVRMLDLLGSCGFDAHDGQSGKRCFWPSKSGLAAALYACSNGRLGAEGKMEHSPVD